MAMDTATRYHGLDALRAWMMLLGVWLHTVVGYSREGNWPYKDPHPTAVYDFTLGIIHAFRMPVFYVMAGFFGALLYARRGRSGFLSNRAKRVLLPFVVGWLVLFPTVVSMMTYARATEQHVSPQSAVQSLASGGLLASLHPMHLWFLEYLVFLYALAFAAVELLPIILPAGFMEGANRFFRRAAGSAWAPILFAPFSVAALCAAPGGGLPDPRGFALEWRVLTPYVVVFGFGWLLYLNRDLLENFAPRCWRYLALATALLPITVVVVGRVPPGMRKYAIATAIGLFMWLNIYGLTGLFLRYFNKPSARMRYLSDSSYFLYLVHMPVLMALQIAFREAAWPAELKVPVVLFTSIPIMLALYHWFVRSTFIGAALNGRRYPREVPGSRFQVQDT